jgi:hypothetical protein
METISMSDILEIEQPGSRHRITKKKTGSRDPDGLHWGT